MVKVKNKKNFGMSDKFHAKKTQTKQKRTLNPFEVHINKEKFKVLGQRSKNDRGLPGVSRAKAIKKRKNTLGHELKLVHKTNTFLDKRIGEKNVALSEEDKIMARFAAERIQQHKMKSDKQSIYNLAEEEILTHRGQTLEEIEKFDDPRSDDEDDFDMNTPKSGKLQGDFVSDANFGGGVLSRNENKDGALSRKDLIEQLIIESKKRKMEKQKLKEETLDLTEKLDTEWKDLHLVVSKDFNKEIEKTKKPETPSIVDKLLSDYEKKNEDYDKMMRELKFAPRGTPSDRLKSEDEIVKIEKDKLEKLEKDRLARMHGTAEIEKSKSGPKHRSADDLDDGYEVDSDPEMMVAYDAEGNVLMSKNRISKSGDEDHQSDEENEKSDSENESSNEEGSGDEEDKSGNEEEKPGDEEGGSGDESEDSLCDLREPDEQSESEDEEDDQDKIEEKKKGTKRCLDNGHADKTKQKKKKENGEENINKKVLIIGVTTDKKNNLNNSNDVLKNKDINQKNEVLKNKEATNEDNSAADKIKADLLARKGMMEKAAAELPYTFNMPKDYDELQELLEKQLPDYQNVIVERIIKCNHPKLGEGNKAKLGTLFAYLLQYVNDLFCNDSVTSEDSLLNSFRCFDRLSCHIYDLAQMDPNNAKNCIVEVIKEKYEEYKKKPNIYPSLDTIIFFKLVSLLFPTSDLKHPVVTPCFIFLSQMLTSCKIRNNKDVAKGLFLTTLILEYTVLSKRILPAAINFIRGIFFLCIPKILNHGLIVLRPFKALGPRSNLLVLQNPIKQTEKNTNWTMVARHLINKNEDDEFKVRALMTGIKIFDDFFKQSGDLPIQKPLFEEHLILLEKIPKENYPEGLVSLMDEVIMNARETLKNKRIEPLVEENKRPKTLKLYEPSIEKEFNGKKRRQISKEKAEHEKLVYKHKKEMKGALREIRRDKTFISSVKIKEKIQSDNIRKQKVKQIYSEASMQQGELNALERSKKKKK